MITDKVVTEFCYKLHFYRQHEKEECNSCVYFTDETQTTTYFCPINKIVMCSKNNEEALYVFVYLDDVIEDFSDYNLYFEELQDLANLKKLKEYLDNQ